MEWFIFLAAPANYFNLQFLPNFTHLRTEKIKNDFLRFNYLLEFNSEDSIPQSSIL